MTYLLMSVPFVGVALVVFCVGALHARKGGSLPHYLTSWAMASLALLVLTAVFDNVMIAAGFFDYGAEEISGFRLGLIPLEDLLYPLAAGLLLTGVWQLFGGNQAGESTDV
ncbi:lycopene cyclase [Microbacterium sp. CH12i]|uniref:lycopene cyclase domain-containing protein n=1 Tax=Microbacterium sp. CH12i TaxID=1479651 RepID=UPI0004610EDA|nr:lycopene cyclase domain-containing protein [Microbacterium sp. CH12i]KDA05622.1 lycopene cyclase [Microbacterium sp. CH12i]